MKRITNITKRIIPLFLLLCFITYAKAGDNKIVTLITSGQGKTSDEVEFIEWANDYQHYLALRQEVGPVAGAGVDPLQRAEVGVAHEPHQDVPTAGPPMMSA